MTRRVISYVVALLVAAFLVAACNDPDVQGKDLEDLKVKDSNLKVATLAGGCFWCVEADMEKLPGVVEVISGFAGGTMPNPTYEQVSSGKTKYVEAVQVYYDPKEIDYRKILEAFWMDIDPTDAGGMFVDRGFQYTGAIFYHDAEQKKIAEETKMELEKSKLFSKPVVTRIVPFTTFYPAEEYHQNYYKKNPIRYKFYRNGSGRDRFIDSIWGDKKHRKPWPSGGAATASAAGTMADTKKYVLPSDAELKKELSPLAYDVVRKGATEKPFKNAYWDNYKPGIYVDVVSGEPLFSSTDKYKSGTGWPSFSKPLVPGNLVEKEDKGLFTTRTEIRSRHADSHLGHVFNDGPPPTGLRYCMNSAAMRFIPEQDMKKDGYGEFLYLFQNKS